MTQVIITKAQLQESKACRAYLSSPEWDAQEERLVYSDWESTVERLLSSRQGIVYLDFLVMRGLAPMTREELKTRRASLPVSLGGNINTSTESQP